MKISEFVLKILNDRTNKHQKITISKVSPDEAEIIKRVTNIDLNGYTHIIDSFGVKHVIRQHSNLFKEKNRGLISLTINDFDRIPDIIKNFDEVKFGGKNKIGRNVLIFIKRINGYVFYVEEIRSPQKKEAVLLTMYIKSKKSSTD